MKEYQNTADAADIDGLLAWYDKERRILPWREDPTPYHVWISEIMLQQTRVEAVKAYYARFLAELPDIRALAEAQEDTLLKLWEGLGYYSRVRNLKKAAVQVMEEYGGRMPESSVGLRKLSGIGPYTSAAIASIAFGERIPAIDGNLMRIFSRMTGYGQDVKTDAARREAEAWYLDFFPENRPGDANQALMDLGAMVCLPNGKPACERCPWERDCAARREGKECSLPVTAQKKARRVEERTVFILRRGEGESRVYAIRKRPAEGLLAGLFEFPNTAGTLDEAQVREYVLRMGFQPLRIQPAGKAKHIFTHIEWHMTGWLADIAPPVDPDAEGGSADDGSVFFAGAADLEERWSVPSAFSKWYGHITDGSRASGQSRRK
ncbi:MAG: A/G-specific adenine glycosylase [Clostridium sp.]|nr:A/G-specific adenine glycosylase [Clostridium sp.]